MGLQNDPSKKDENNQIIYARRVQYAKKAISIIIHDSVETFNFAEWKGDGKFTIEPPTTALEWAKYTKRWFGSTL
jgi:hypothetical protein